MLLRDALSVTDVRRETWGSVLAALGDSGIVQRRMAMKFLPRLDRISRALPSPTAIGDGNVTTLPATFTKATKHLPH
jgi:hypothetical protein